MKPYIIGFYGESDTGKTTLIVEIIKCLSNEGFNVASVKITDKKAGIDSEGKDTWKHAQAGSKLVVFSTGSETDFVFKNKMSGNELMKCINCFGIYDIIIVEGVNDEKIPKVRLGKIKERENTISTYDDDFQNLITFIKSEIRRK